MMVIKRSLSPGFAGIPNELFVAPNTVDAVRRRKGDGAGVSGGDAAVSSVR